MLVDGEECEEEWADAAKEVVDVEERRRESRMLEVDLCCAEMDLLDALMRRVILRFHSSQVELLKG